MIRCASCNKRVSGGERCKGCRETDILCRKEEQVKCGNCTNDANKRPGEMSNLHAEGVENLGRMKANNWETHKGVGKSVKQEGENKSRDRARHSMRINTVLQSELEENSLSL